MTSGILLSNHVLISKVIWTFIYPLLYRTLKRLCHLPNPNNTRGEWFIAPTRKGEGVWRYNSTTQNLVPVWVPYFAGFPSLFVAGPHPYHSFLHRAPFLSNRCVHFSFYFCNAYSIYIWDAAQTRLEGKIPRLSLEMPVCYNSKINSFLFWAVSTIISPIFQPARALFPTTYISPKPMSLVRPSYCGPA